MRRTTISLPDELAAALEREARRLRLPVSRVARDALEAYLGLAAEGERDLPFIGIAASIEPGTHAADLEGYLERHWPDDIEADAVPGRR
jgi:metal-responsive CopG/Arc/MetJ family transcriptional regulator